MTELILHVEDNSLLPHLKKILESIRGVTIEEKLYMGKSGLDEAYEDMREGRITHYDSVDDMFKAMGI